MMDLLETRNIYHVFDLMSDMVLCFDHELRLTYMNSVAEFFFGFSRDEAIGKDVTLVLPQEYRAVHRRFLQHFQGKDQLRLRGRLFYLKIICRSSMRVPVSLSLSLLNTEAGLMFAAIIRRRKSMPFFSENSLYPAQDPKTSLGAVCHELKNPLVAIGGFARRVAQDKGLSEKSRHEMDIIQQEVGRLERLINGLNDLSKGSAYHFEYADLTALLRRLHEIMAQQAREEGKEVGLEVLMPALPYLLLDQDRISQVLMNLIHNALQACAIGGKVILRLDLAEGEDFIRIDVIDNGQGMSNDAMEKIFQPFFTTKKSGTGLGLPVSKRIIEDHGGSLQIHSQAGQGTTVSIFLPF